MNSRDLDESYGIDSEEDEEVEYGDQWVEVSEVLQVIELGPIYLMGMTEEAEAAEVIDSWEFQIMEFDENYDVYGNAAPANDHDKFEPSETASEETETEWDEDDMETVPGFQRRNNSEESETTLVVDDSGESKVETRNQLVVREKISRGRKGIREKGNATTRSEVDSDTETELDSYTETELDSYTDTEEEDAETEWEEKQTEGRKAESENEKASSQREKSPSDGEDTETEPECEYDDSVFENDDSETKGHMPEDQVDAEDGIIHQDVFPAATNRLLIINESNLKPRAEKNVLENVAGVNRRHDFHTNPMSAINEGPHVDLLRCSVCHNFSSGDIFVCRERGHLICEDCQTLFLTYGQTLCTVPRPVGNLLTSKPCNSSFQPATNKQLELLSDLKFRCLHKDCDFILHGPSLWNAHITSCPVFNMYVKCPMWSCPASNVLRENFVSHCVVEHNIKVDKPEKQGEIHRKLFPGNLPRVPTIIAVFQYEKGPIYVTVNQEQDTLLRLAAFTVDRDADWAGSKRVLLQFKNRGNYGLTTTLKINPTERHYEDLKLFGRSQTFHFDRLRSIFCGSNQQTNYTPWPLKMFVKDSDVIQTCSLTAPPDCSN